MKKADDAKQFRHWLDDPKSDSEKRQRLTCQYNLLRYIQQVGYTEAFNKIIALVPEEHRELFKQLMENYVHVSLPTRKLTKNGNEIHPYLNNMCVDGKLDPDVIDILVYRQILRHWKGSNPIHLRLLSPMCYILIKWDHSISNNTNHHPMITFNGQPYNALELIGSDNLPSLDELTDMDLDTAKRRVLGCIDFALGSKEQLHWNDIHGDYKLSFCLLKLWLHRKTEHSKSLEVILMALIISFLKHILLDTYGETKGKHPKMNIFEDICFIYISERSPISEALPEKSYRQHSHRDLKSYFSLKECADLREKIKKYAKTVLSNKEIEEELEECQQFYKELSMVNQFFKQPFDMPPPEFYFSRLTCPLAVCLNQSKNFRKDIETLCSGNQLLAEFIEELYEFFVPSIPSTVQ
jgi:hypothetical protein